MTKGMICANTKTRIDTAVAQSTRKRKSQPSLASTARTDMNTGYGRSYFDSFS